MAVIIWAYILQQVLTQSLDPILSHHKLPMDNVSIKRIKGNLLLKEQV